MTYLLSAVFSFLIAILVSILGLGGGFLYIPLFTWLGFNYKFTAIPTALLLNIAVTIVAQRNYISNKMTDVKTAVIISAPAIVMAQVSVYANKYTPENILKIIFAIVIILTAAEIIFFERKKIEPEAVCKVSNMVLIIAGAASGVLSGLLGVAGGFVVTPVLLFNGYQTKKAAATSSMVVLFSSLSAFTGHVIKNWYIAKETTERYSLSTFSSAAELEKYIINKNAFASLDLKLIAICLICVIAGAHIGSHLMVKKVKAHLIKEIFAFVLILIAIKLLIEAAI